MYIYIYIIYKGIPYRFPMEHCGFPMEPCGFPVDTWIPYGAFVATWAQGPRWTLNAHSFDLV